MTKKLTMNVRTRESREMPTTRQESDVELRKERMEIFQRKSRRRLSNSSELNMKSMS